jgi:hypothetical protein
MRIAIFLNKGTNVRSPIYFPSFFGAETRTSFKSTPCALLFSETKELTYAVLFTSPLSLMWFAQSFIPYFVVQLRC